MNDCEHAVQLHGLCAICGMDITQLAGGTLVSPYKYNTNIRAAIDDPLVEESIGASLAVLHNNPGLKEANRLDRESTEKLISRRMLSLVVDLDQTVLHATLWSPELDSLVGDSIHRITLRTGGSYLVRIRPHLEEVLEQLASRFELHIYTMGTRDYADAIVRIIDPTGRFFHDRVLTRDEHQIVEYRKDLRRIFPCNDRMVLIIDDRADVWRGCRNLVPVRPFVFWRPLAGLTAMIGGGNQHLGRDVAIGASIDEIALGDTELWRIRDLLFGIHDQFYPQSAPPSNDVKTIVDGVKRRALEGACIAFAGLYDEDYDSVLEEFGARRNEHVLSGETTHLVIGRYRPQRDDVLRASEDPCIAIVREEWLIQSMAAWAKQDEYPFLIPLEDLKLDLLEPSSKEESEHDSVSEDSEEDDFIEVPHRKKARQETAADVLDELIDDAFEKALDNGE